MRITGVCLLVMVMAAIGCHKPVANNLPPSEMLAHPGPGVDGPGPGVLSYQPAIPPVAAASQIYFVGPEGLTVQWDVTAPGRFDSEQLVAPARYNFPQGAMYRLKLANIPGRPGVELFPTLEVGPAMPRTEAFLAHNAIPVEFTDEDFDQVMTGNFVTKVIYLPDPEFQEMALAGVGTLVSTRLDPGVDPIVEADRRGAIMAIVRLGNKDLAIASATAEMMPGGADGNARSLPAAGLCGRHDRAAVRHADQRHADRTGRTSARSLGSARRLAEAHDSQPYARFAAAARHARTDRRAAGAGNQLSRAGQPRPHRGTNRGEALCNVQLRPPCPTDGTSVQRRHAAPAAAAGSHRPPAN